MKELALHLVKSLADRPDDVRMEVIEEGDAVTLFTSPRYGQIIGGRKVIKAVRARSYNAAKTGKAGWVD